jgi:hypothetical protein
MALHMAPKTHSVSSSRSAPRRGFSGREGRGAADTGGDTTHAWAGSRNKAQSDARRGDREAPMPRFPRHTGTGAAAGSLRLDRPRCPSSLARRAIRRRAHRVYRVCNNVIGCTIELHKGLQMKGREERQMVHEGAAFQPRKRCSAKERWSKNDHQQDLQTRDGSY